MTEPEPPLEIIVLPPNRPAPNIWAMLAAADAVAPEPVDHRVWTGDDLDNDERMVWECDCGAGGSCPSWHIDVASDKHIDYARGDTRTDTSRRPE